MEGEGKNTGMRHMRVHGDRWRDRGREETWRVQSGV